MTPVIAGLDEHSKPLICTYDNIGAMMRVEDFVVAGTPSEQLYGVCESFWKPHMVMMNNKTNNRII